MYNQNCGIIHIIVQFQMFYIKLEYLIKQI